MTMKTGKNLKLIFSDYSESDESSQEDSDISDGEKEDNPAIGKRSTMILQDTTRIC